jgi:hypothetical protein
VPTRERWKPDPDEHDYPAAQDYLSLVFPEPVASRLVEELRAAPLVHRKAKDLLRASGLTILPEDNVHVASDLAKVRKGERLSPVLLIRGDAREGLPLVIADGYHRICASHALDEDADIPCRLVSLPPSGPPGEEVLGP